MAKKSLKSLEGLIGFGENQKGFTAQTVNGTAHAFGTGWNKDLQSPTQEQVEAGGVWQGRSSTRTGE